MLACLFFLGTVFAQYTPAPSASIWGISPQSAADNQDVTINFRRNGDVNYVNLWIDGADDGNYQTAYPLNPGGGGVEAAVVWPASHSKHTPGTHMVGIHPYYCNPANTNDCQGGGVDWREVTITAITAPAYSACGQSGPVWTEGGYLPLQPADCNSSQYLSISVSNGYLLPICAALPVNTQKTADGCGYVAITAPTATPTQAPTATATPTPTGPTTTPTRTPTPTPSAVVTPTPTTQLAQGAAINITNSQTQTSNQTVTVNPAAAGAAVQPARVLGVSTGVKRLPKTGLPQAVWSIMALIPLGWKLRRFGYQLKNPTTLPGKFWWEKREYQKRIA